MALLRAALFWSSFYLVHGRDERQLQATAAGVGNLAEKIGAANNATKLAEMVDEKLVDNSVREEPEAPSISIFFFKLLAGYQQFPKATLAADGTIIEKNLFWGEGGVFGISGRWTAMFAWILPFPVMLLTFGLGATCYMWINSMKAHHERKIAQYKKSFMDTDRGFQSSSVGNTDRTYPAKRPSLDKVGQRTCFIAFFLLLLSGLALGSLFNVMYMVDGVLEDLAPEAIKINETMNQLQPQVHNANLWLSDWLTSCAGFDQIKATFGSTAQFQKLLSMNQEYVGLLENKTMIIYNVSKQTKMVPDAILSAHDLVNSIIVHQGWVILVTCFPVFVLLISLICFLRCAIKDQKLIKPEEVEELEARASGKEPGCCEFPFHNKKSASRAYAGLVCCNCLVVWGAFWTCIVCLILGVFCNDTNENSVNLASAFGYGNGTSMATNMTGYYLMDKPKTNFIVEALRDVRNTLELVANNLWLIKPALDAVGLFCNDIGNIDVAQMLSDAVPNIEQILPLTKKDRVFHYYNELANRGVCKNAANSLSMALVIQTIIGCFLVPWVGVKLHNFMSATEAYNEHKMYRKDEETKRLLNHHAGVYYCENCRATFEKPLPPKQEWFTNVNDTRLVYESKMTQFETAAKELRCPECGSKRLVPGPRKQNYDYKVDFKPACSMM